MWLKLEFYEKLTYFSFWCFVWSWRIFSCFVQKRLRQILHSKSPSFVCATLCFFKLWKCLNVLLHPAKSHLKFDPNLITIFLFFIDGSSICCIFEIVFLKTITGSSFDYSTDKRCITLSWFNMCELSFDRCKHPS